MDIKKDITVSDPGVTSTLQWIIKIGIYLSLLTPLLAGGKFFFPFVGPKSFYFMAIAEVIFFAWLILNLYTKEYRPKSNMLTWALVIFLYFITLSAIFGVNPSNSFWSKHERVTGLLMMYHLFAYFLVLSSTFKTKRDWFSFFAGSAGVATIVALLSFRPNIIGIDAVAARGGATLGNSSFLGSYLLFNIFFSLYNLFTSKRFWKIIWIVLIAIMFAAMVSQGARAAAAATVGGLVLFGLFYLAFIPKKKAVQWSSRGLIIILVITGIVFAFLAFQKDSFVQKFIMDHSAGSRFITLKASWQAFLEKPWLGWGWENFDSIWTKFYNSLSPTRAWGGEYWYDKAHNVIAETACTAGILGLVSYLAIFAVAIFMLAKHYFKKKNFWAPAAMICLLIAYFIQNLTVFDMVSSYIMLFAALAFIVYITSADDVPSPIKNRFNLNQTAKILVSLIFFGSLIVSTMFFVIKPLKSSHYLTRVSMATTTQERLTYFKKSISESRLGIYQNRSFLAKSTLEISRNTEIMQKISKETFAQEMEFIIEEMEKNSQEAKWDMRGRMDLSQLYAFGGLFLNIGFDAAQKTAEEALALSPDNQQALWNLSQILAFQKKYDESLEHAKKAIDLAPLLPDSYYLYLRVALVAGKKDLAKTMATQAIATIPDPDFKTKIDSIFGQFEAKK